jgi:hypothetical protein
MIDAIENDCPLAGATLSDRRRPSRANHENAHLIALLRDQPLITNLRQGASYESPEALPVGLGLEAARGTVTGLFVGAAMWMVVIFALWHLL